MKKYLTIIVFILFVSLGLVACDTDEETECPVCDNHQVAEKIEYPALSEYQPTTFSESSYNIDGTTTISEGVVHQEISYNLNNNSKVKVNVIEIDLQYAQIKSSTYNNQTSFSKLATVYEQVQAFEEDTNKTVLAAANADFFGNGRSVNAFVKDGVIVKDAHNDNGGYDYTNVNHDLPASMPMLFGVSCDVAQIAPIIQSNSVQETVQSKLFYNLVQTNAEKESTIVASNNIILNTYSYDSNNINIIFKTAREATVESGATLVTLNRHNDSHDTIHGKIKSIEDVSSTKKVQASSEEYFIVIPAKLEVENLQVGSFLSYHITTSDNTWQYYDTIIGARQALVLSGEIASTVKLENSNGAQRTDVPRTAIAIKADGKVALVTVEALRYGSKSNSDDDGYGVNLPQLADFLRYYGAVNACNFDGGGSTQLLVRNASNQLEVAVRSSDYGTYELNDGRRVINTILICSKD